jgi:carbonic anhydrase
MSIFSSQTTWPAQCLSANQSPIDLSLGTAEPCNVTCDLVMDDGMVSQAKVGVSDEGLWITGSLGSLKFRGESYVCTTIHIVHPASHTIHGVQADAEVIAYCNKPTGELLCVSALIRANTSQTSSYSFFKQIVPYALPQETDVKLNNWSLASIVPPTSAFFTYTGSTIVPPCTGCEWVVFQTMINMDTDDFAYLVKSSEAGFRTIQGLGDRKVFFNDTQNLSGTMPNDGRLYLKLRPTGNTQLPSGSVNKSVSLPPIPEDPDKPTSLLGKGRHALKKHIEENGGLVQTLEFWLMVALLCGGAYLGYHAAKSTPLTGEWVPPWAKWFVETIKSIPPYIYSWFVYFISFIRRIVSFFTFGNAGQPLTSGLSRTIPGKVLSGPLY